MGQLLNTVEAVVFDMDGVLIDARDWHYRALNDALGIFDVEISFEDHLDRFNGLPTAVKLRTLSEEGRLPWHLHEIVSEVKQERTLREAATLCFPRVDHLLLMTWLKERKLKIGVATNSIRHTSQTMLGFSGLLDSLDVLVTNEDVSSPKPAPDIYVKAAALLGVHPRSILVIEDHDYGVAAARSAGCQVIRVDGVEDVSVHLLESWDLMDAQAGVL
jgi:beta-phosphoglucomutase-like phosphatase (HAD superfamily)